MDWQFDGDRPIYTQLVEQLQLAIATGEFPPASRLPGVRELAAEAGVNPNTMQRALAELETLGLAHTQRTSGRFVTDDAARIAALRAEMAAGRARTFVQAMLALGCSHQEIDTCVQQAKEEAHYE